MPARSDAAVPAGLWSHAEILQVIAEGASFSTALDLISLRVERALPGSHATIMLFSDDRHLAVAAAPSLPAEFRAAIDDTEIGPDGGSCGRAAHEGRLVVTADIATDPAWKRWRETAAASGICACWSVPFFGPSKQVLGTFAVYLQSPRSPQPGELEVLREAGNFAAVAVAQDAAERKLTERAGQDPLTGLANRTALAERLRAAQARAGETGLGYAIILVGVDAAEMINDTFGHAVRDEIMALVARRLVRDAGTSATVARVWGDKFAVLLEDLHDGEAAPVAAEQLRGVLNEPYDVEGLDLLAPATFGVIVVPADQVAAVEDPLRAASAALEQARSIGPGHIGVYDRQGSDREQTADIEPELRRSIAANELTLAYQPIVRLPDPAPVRYEALLRWTSSRRGPVSPAAFVPIAERAGLAADLGRFVLTDALTMLGTFRADPSHDQTLGLSVNVGAQELADEQLPAMLAVLLDANAVPAESITLEVTESSLIRGGGAGWRALAALDEMGVRVALDDFGVGFSQLSYLLQFNFDELKIDRSFVTRLLAERPARVIVGHIIAMARDLGLEVVAEGIERPDQRDLLLELGATYGQGYLFGAAGPFG